MTHDLPLVLTIRELAPMLRSSVRSIERALAAGTFPLHSLPTLQRGGGSLRRLMCCAGLEALMTIPEAQDAVFEAIVARMTEAVTAHDWLTVRICVQMLHALAARREAV